MVRVPAFVLLMAACGGEAPSKTPGAPTTPPDESFETGGGLAHRVLVWKCNARNERVVMHQQCAEGLTGCDDWQVSRTLCPTDPAGREVTRTPFERTLRDGEGDRQPIPDGHGWR